MCWVVWRCAVIVHVVLLHDDIMLGPFSFACGHTFPYVSCCCWCLFVAWQWRTHDGATMTPNTFDIAVNVADSDNVVCIRHVPRFVSHVRVMVRLWYRMFGNLTLLRYCGFGFVIVICCLFACGRWCCVRIAHVPRYGVLSCDVCLDIHVPRRSQDTTELHMYQHMFNN